MVAEIDDDDFAVRRGRYVVGPVHLARFLPVNAERAPLPAVGREHLYTMVTAVRHQNVAFPIDGQPLGPVQVAPTETIDVDHLGSVLAENVHLVESMLVEVGHQHGVGRREAHASGRVEHPPSVAVEVVPENDEKLAVGPEDLHAVVARIRYGHVSVVVHGDVPRVVEVCGRHDPVLVLVRFPHHRLRGRMADHTQEVAVQGEYLNAMIILVRDDDVTFPGKSHSGRSVQLAGLVAESTEMTNVASVGSEYL